MDQQQSTAEQQAATVAEAIMAKTFEQRKRYLMEYLRLHALRISAETQLETLARQEWSAWRALISPRKGGFSEADLKRQAIIAPSPAPRRDRGRKKRAKTSPPANPAAISPAGDHDGSNL